MPEWVSPIDLRPGIIMRDLADVPWEQTNRAADLARLCAVEAEAG